MPKKCWFHKWELRDSGGHYGTIDYYVCSKCNIVKIVKNIFGRRYVIYHNFPIPSCDVDIDSHEMCMKCGSTNIYYCPQFCYDNKYKKERVAGICECLDCGYERSVT
ncbi:MAG: hypothetical protein KJ847_02480 [Firmicutes bacterium]|nr:hypothetical protein [Bacillota bacterium]